MIDSFVSVSIDLLDNSVCNQRSCSHVEVFLGELDAEVVLVSPLDKAEVNIGEVRVENVLGEELLMDRIKLLDRNLMGLPFDFVGRFGLIWGSLRREYVFELLHSLL